MFLSIVIVLATALLSAVSAQSSTGSGPTGTSSSSSSTGTASAAVTTHTCSVGADGFNFTPNTIYAAVGDIIEFRFYPQNHSVARAAFGNLVPCIPYEDTGPGLVGFWSGFRPVAVVLSKPPIFNLLINDTEPVFFYCSAPGACFDGMVGVINPNSTFTFAAQFAYSQNATEEFSPLEYFPKEVAPTRTTTATGATSTPTVPAATTSAAAASSGHSGLSGGAIAGIAIGAAAVVILAGALIYMCGRQKSLGEILRHSQRPAPTGHNSYVAASPGISEANYSNMQKVGHASVMSGTYSDQGYRGPGTETESYRSMSPPIDERTGMMSVLHPNQQAVYMRNGQPSPGTPGSAAFPSPAYTHEMDPNAGGLRPPPPPEDQGPHELSGAGTSPDATSPRPFSFTESESGYRPQYNDQKIDPMVR